MSGETWPKGTVAMVTTNDGRILQAQVDSSEGWDCCDGSYCLSGDVAVRPLLVLDPDDAEQMQALADGYWTTLANSSVSMPARLAGAVRSLLPQPTPTEPDEPTGFGARVRLRDGKLAVRVYNKSAGSPWRCSDRTWREWADLDVVEVLDAGEPS